MKKIENKYAKIFFCLFFNLNPQKYLF
jgi:hypothetical protein